MPEPVRVRFAPSPTGYLHIGGVRTALFNYLFARSRGGKFLLRIEDTDLERSKPEFETEIIESLEWLGLKADEAIDRQSSHFELYRQKADELVKQGKAYVDEKGGKAVLFRMPKTRVAFDDLVHGKIEIDTATWEDLALIKSDGSPTYNFACAVDDSRMAITHVIRGDDHISNTPKQILLYQALGTKVPIFAHLPLIVGEDGAPLSKRHGAVALPAYRQEGFLAEGLLNYLALLGWSPGTNQEIFSLAELVQKFKIEQVNAKSAYFDALKIRWVNGEHIRLLPEPEFNKLLAGYTRKYAGWSDALDEAALHRASVVFKPRVKTFKEFLDQADYFFKSDLEYDPEAIKKHWQDEKVKENLEKLRTVLAAEDFDDPAKLEARTRETAKELGVSAGALIHPSRVALTGKSVSPGIFEVMSGLGKEKVLARLDYAVRNFSGLKEKVHG